MRVVMMGTGTFAEPTFQALLASPAVEVVGLVTQPDRASGDRSGSTRQTGVGMKPLAEAAGVPVAQPVSINTPEGVSLLQTWRPDLLVVAAYGQILKRDVLEAAPLGGINVHASLLPRHRGAAPVAYAILAGDAETGVTIIRMSVGLDAGDTLAQVRVAIDPAETAGELEFRLAPLGAVLAVDVTTRLAAGPVAGDKQDPTLVTRAPKLTKEQGVIDWTQPADAVCRHVRAMQPWPTAYSFLHRAGQPPLRVAVNLAAVVDGSGEPGAVVPSPGRLVVATGDGAVEVRELQPAGKKRMAAAEFLRGRPVAGGDRFAAG